MSRARQLLDQVTQAQEQLGRGEVEEALGAAEPLRERAVRMLGDVRLTSFERTMAAGALTYSTITLILGTAEKAEPQESIPRIRGWAVDTLRRHRPGGETWKVLAAAGEMLARAGDARGACWAIKKSRQIKPGEDYLVQLSGSIQSMYPQAYGETPDEPPDEPPPVERTGKR